MFQLAINRGIRYISDGLSDGLISQNEPAKIKTLTCSEYSQLQN